MNQIGFVCMAVGYPNAKLLAWKTGTGLNVSDMMFNVTYVHHNSNVTLHTIVSVNLEICRRSKGFSCTYTNMGHPKIDNSTFFHCPPGDNLVYIRCYWCYCSHVSNERQYV